ncbi:MAG: hypothetical protein PHY04_00130 [Candidatus ainarchaeum sp.]|jgi:hypothetical protein|nr:hypothetical protein [Candidatus ainarchaeum sp.]MDD4128130.1 hypothetical protein [Candidatus ainarchaeum sp.]
MQSNGLDFNSGFDSKEKSNSFVYLTKVEYFENKHEILVEFSSKNKKLINRFHFFPFVYISSFLDKNKLVDLILDFGFKGFSLEEEGNNLVLRTLSFSDLKKICNLIAVVLNKKPIVLDPSRSFLVEKNWSFFDVFEEISGDLFKVDLTDVFYQESFLNDFDLSSFLTKGIPFSDAFRINENQVTDLIKSAVWGNILSLPIELVPNRLEDKIELFLEKIFFKNAQLISFDFEKEIFLDPGFQPFFKKDNLSKIDFSSIWFDLFSNNFFNIGPDSKNCSCCSPVTLESNNILPSSLIRVEFLEDNFFFESSSPSFSFSFHTKMPFKNLRVNKRKEFFLNSFPVGPFFKGDLGLIPINDAKNLIKNEGVRIVSSKDSLAFIQNNFSVEGVHELNWFCKNKESFFSKEVKLINSILSSLNNLIDSNQKSLFSKKTFGFFYSKILRDSLQSIFFNIPFHLTNSSSKFYSYSLACSIVSIQEATLAKFLEFSKNNGYRVIHANKSNAFVKGFSSLTLTKSFAQKHALPQPQISGFAGGRSKKFL